MALSKTGRFLSKAEILGVNYLFWRKRNQYFSKFFPFRAGGGQVPKSCATVWHENAAQGTLTGTNGHKLTPNLRSLEISTDRWKRFCSSPSKQGIWVRSRPGKPNQRKGQNEKFMNSGVFPQENKHDSHRTFVPECPCEKFMN